MYQYVPILKLKPTVTASENIFVETRALEILPVSDTLLWY
jgi:hypothetical protein